MEGEYRVTCFRVDMNENGINVVAYVPSPVFWHLDWVGACELVHHLEAEVAAMEEGENGIWFKLSPEGSRYLMHVEDAQQLSRQIRERLAGSR